MSLILNIDTSGTKASVCISNGENIIHMEVNNHMSDHAAWLHPAIKRILSGGKTILNPDAVAVTIGPGSYTGLRVGLATAKGICYVKGIPLITIGTLEMIAFSVKEEAVDLICPMIDARRDEVFMALYDKNMTVEETARPLILNDSVFSQELSSRKILFCGSGSKKLQRFIDNKNASYSDKEADTTNLAFLSAQYFEKNNFASLAYTEPDYLKEFYTTRN